MLFVKLSLSLCLGVLMLSPAYGKSIPQEVLASSADIAEKTLPSIVNIASSKKVQRMSHSPFFGQDPFLNRFFQFPQQGPSEEVRQGQGSGVLVDSEGTILTNYHVIKDADDIQVTLHNKEQYKAELIGKDPKSDLAVIKIKGKNLPFLPLGDSEKVRIGEGVLAIGNPFGLGGTVTAGIISAKGRSIGIAEYEDFLQTDAAINPGNSGGALLNMKGELIGINTAIYSRSGGYQGIGFAIPSNMAKTIMDSLLENGKVSRGFLGVGIRTLDKDLQEAFGVEKGILIEQVQEDSPAKKAGLLSGDVVVQINGEPSHEVTHMRNTIAGYAPGTTVDITIVRDNKTMVKSVVLAELPDRSMGLQGTSHNTLGLQLQNTTPQRLRQLGMPTNIEGVLVADMKPQSPAHLAGLKVNDVVLSLNRKPTDSVQTFQKLLSKAKGKVLLQINRQGRTQFVVVRLKG